MNNENIQTGIQYFKAGNKTGALQTFLQVLEQEPNNEIAWLWLAACVDKPEQKRDCFHKVLAINPTNTNAQKALAELELQTIPEAKPIPQQGNVLKCPSCGSVMGKPDHTGLVQCDYCGTIITYHPPVEKVEQRNIEKYLEICNSSLDGKNYNETIVYANKILEIDPKNSSAWINKGIATSWLTTSMDNRYDEAMGYLEKAEELSLNKEPIQKIKEKITYEQAYWYTHLGDKNVEQGEKTYSIYADDNGNDYSGEAGNNSEEYFNKAMEYYLLAAAYLPNDSTISQNIQNLVSNMHWSKASSKANMESFLRRKNEKHVNLLQELSQAQNDLAKLTKGMFNTFKIEDAEEKVKKIQNAIAENEKEIGKYQRLKDFTERQLYSK